MKSRTILQVSCISLIFACLLASAAQAQTAPPAGMVGWWAGDGNAKDVSGNGLNGALFNSGGYVVGEVGQGFDFRAGGTSNPSHLQVPDNAALRPAQFTIEAWVKFSPVFDNYHVAIAKGFALGDNDSYALAAYSNGTSGNPQFFTTHNGSSHLLAAPANLTNPNSWNHLAASYDGNTKRLYVNGVLVASVFVGLPVQYDANPAPLTIGADWQSQPFFQFNGLVDEPALYNRTLSDPEILAIYNAGVGGKTKSAATSAGASSQTLVNDATITFQNVTTAGTTTDYTIDPATAGTLPAGYTQTGLAYDISTTGVYSNSINLCFHIPAINIESVFNRLRVLHAEGGVLVDKTTATNFGARLVCSSVTSLSPFVIANGLAPTAAPATISGQVTTADGTPLAGATILLSGSSTQFTITDANGFYSIADLEAGGFHTVTPSRANYSFSPSSRSFSLVADQTEAVFTATPAGGTANALDTTEFFVRQHYLDFLGREPDQSGLNFWTNNIESCGANSTCRAEKRVDTSAAFFLSIEFQQTGFLVERVYQSAFNRFPAYREFTRDTQEVGRDVIVGNGTWQAQLDANKQQFATNFVARLDFVAVYGGLSNDQYVDALNANTGTSLSASDRNDLVAELNGGTETRAGVLRKVSESAAFTQREFNRAFVLMQYFGYLRRNPSDAPDSDFSGYNFWLAKLNSFGGDFRKADMVKAFITASEYRGRFGGEAVARGRAAFNERAQCHGGTSHPSGSTAETAIVRAPSGKWQPESENEERKTI